MSRGSSSAPGESSRSNPMLGCIDEEVEAAVVGATECDDVQQPHRSEAGQQAKCQNDHAQDQTPLPAPTALFA